jgi:hypothetical protein
MEFAFIFGNQYSIAVTSFHFVPLRQHVRPVLESNHEFNEAPVISNALSLSFRMHCPCHFERSEKSWSENQDFSVAASHFVRDSLLRNDKG